MLALAFSPVKRVIKGQAYPDGSKPPDIVICELTTGQERVRFKAHGPSVHPLYFSPSGNLLMYGDGTDIWVYEAPSGKEILRLKGHQGAITEMVFSADESRLVSASIDTTALVWDISRLSHSSQRPAQRLGRAQFQSLWSDLAGRDAARAYRAIRALAAGPESIPFLERELLAVGRLFPERKAQVERLIPLLESEQFEQREEATRELKKLGDDVELLLRAVLTGEPSAEVHRRITLVLQGMDGKPPGAETLRVLRAVEVLEQTGSADARRTLQILAEGPAKCRLTREAKASLERLEKRAKK
jgi:hypothetical protein